MELLYSSDYYVEFKKDIYAISSLPNDYAYRFRYPSEVTSDWMKQNYGSCQNSEALIIFVTGNDGTKEPNSFGYQPIRLAEIIEIVYDAKTDDYHVFFQLKEFISIQNFNITQLDESPLGNVFLGHQTIRPAFDFNTNWIGVVERLSTYEPILFFRMEIRDHLGNELKPNYERLTNRAFYSLKENADYSIIISFADFSDSLELHELRTFKDVSDISSDLDSAISSGLKKDYRQFTISGLQIGDLSSKINLIKFSSFQKKGSDWSSVYSIKVLFKVNRDWSRFWRYLITSFTLFTGAAIATTDLNDLNSTFSIDFSLGLFLKILGLVLGSSATAYLYFSFNKK